MKLEIYGQSCSRWHHICSFEGTFSSKKIWFDDNDFAPARPLPNSWMPRYITYETCFSNFDHSVWLCICRPALTSYSVVVKILQSNLSGLGGCRRLPVIVVVLVDIGRILRDVSPKHKPTVDHILDSFYQIQVKKQQKKPELQLNGYKSQSGNSWYQKKTEVRYGLEIGH